MAVSIACKHGTSCRTASSRCAVDESSVEIRPRCTPLIVTFSSLFHSLTKGSTASSFTLAITTRHWLPCMPFIGLAKPSAPFTSTSATYPCLRSASCGTVLSSRAAAPVQSRRSSVIFSSARRLVPASASCWREASWTPRHCRRNAASCAKSRGRSAWPCPRWR